MKIQEIPKNERPIERLLLYGSEFLNNEELLSILLKTGSRDYSAKELAGIILKKCDGNLSNINYSMLSSIKGVGNVKSACVLAGIEFGRRVNMKNLSLNNIVVNDSSVIFDYYKSLFFNKKQEYFYCVFLDTNKVIIKDKLIFIGTLDHSVVHPREVFKEAILVSASSIICIHNHPSGNVMPSKNDFEITKRLISAGDLLGIRVIDHIIIGSDKYYSFFENADI